MPGSDLYLKALILQQLFDGALFNLTGRRCQEIISTSATPARVTLAGLGAAVELDVHVVRRIERLHNQLMSDERAVFFRANLDVDQALIVVDRAGLEEIARRLRAGRYFTIEDYALDTRRVFANGLACFAAGSPVYQAAIDLVCLLEDDLEKLQQTYGQRMLHPVQPSGGAADAVVTPGTVGAADFTARSRRQSSRQRPQIEAPPPTLAASPVRQQRDPPRGRKRSTQPMDINGRELVLRLKQPARRQWQPAESDDDASESAQPARKRKRVQYEVVDTTDPYQGVAAVASVKRPAAGQRSSARKSKCARHSYANDHDGGRGEDDEDSEDGFFVAEAGSCNADLQAQCDTDMRLAIRLSLQLNQSARRKGVHDANIAAPADAAEIPTAPYGRSRRSERRAP